MCAAVRKEKVTKNILAIFSSKNEISISNTIDIKEKDVITMSENFNNEALFNLGIAKFNEGIFIKWLYNSKSYIPSKGFNKTV